jgi:hypothetical protein
MGMLRTMRVAGGGCLVAAALVAAAGSGAAAAEPVLVSNETVYAEPSFQANRLGQISGSAAVTCQTTADAGSNAGGAVMLEVRGLGVAGDVGYIRAPLGRTPNVPAC